VLAVKSDAQRSWESCRNDEATIRVSQADNAPSGRWIISYTCSIGRPVYQLNGRKSIHEQRLYVLWTCNITQSKAIGGL
jgi:hypothetical protein